MCCPYITRPRADYLTPHTPANPPYLTSLARVGQRRERSPTSRLPRSSASDARPNRGGSPDRRQRPRRDIRWRPIAATVSRSALGQTDRQQPHSPLSRRLKVLWNTHRASRVPVTPARTDVVARPSSAGRAGGGRQGGGGGEARRCESLRRAGARGAAAGGGGATGRGARLTMLPGAASCREDARLIRGAATSRMLTRSRRAAAGLSPLSPGTASPAPWAAAR